MSKIRKKNLRSGYREILNDGKIYPFKWLLLTKKIEIKKIGLRYDICHIPISVHAKFQDNRTNLAGRKTVTDAHTETHTETQKHIDRLEFYIDNHVNFYLFLTGLIALILGFILP